MLSNPTSAELQHIALGLGDGDLQVQYEVAKTIVGRAMQNFINKFDVVLCTTEDELEGLLRLADKMDWHPELFREGADNMVGRCRLPVSKTELKACLLSALETKM